MLLSKKLNQRLHVPGLDRLPGLIHKSHRQSSSVYHRFVVVEIVRLVFLTAWTLSYYLCGLQIPYIRMFPTHTREIPPFRDLDREFVLSCDATFRYMVNRMSANHQQAHQPTLYLVSPAPLVTRRTVVVSAQRLAAN